MEAQSLDPTARRREYGTKRHKMPSGYMRVWEPEHPLANADGHVYEHRKVVFDAGIPVPSGAHVHHVNHDKADNRLENLEVKAPSQHAREHIQESGIVANQFGVWSTDPVETKARRRQALRSARADRAERLAADPTLQPHGSVNTFTNWGCRCRACRDAYTVYRREWRARAK